MTNSNAGQAPWLWVMVGLLVFCPTLPSRAALYQCLDASGNRVFTDSPAQLKNCTVVNPSAPPGSSPSPPAPATAPPPVAPPPHFPAPMPSPGMNPGPSGLTADSPSAEAGAGPIPEQVTVPVERVGRSLVVRVRLNGSREARLILDTGADITILSHAVAQDLGIVPSASSPTITLNTVGGSVRAEVVKVDAVGIGTAEANNVQVAVHDLPDAPPGVDGLLGLTFLEKFLVTVDSQKGELHLRPRQ